MARRVAVRLRHIPEPSEDTMLFGHVLGDEMTGIDAPRSRRAVLATAVGAAAAAAAATLSRPLTATAATGDPLILGQLNAASDMTELNGRFVVNGGGEGWESLGAWSNAGTALYGTSEEGSASLGETHGSNGSESAGVHGGPRSAGWGSWPRTQGAGSGCR